MTTCCSLQCEKKYDCAKHCFNVVGAYPSEDYSTFGSGSISNKGCKVNYWCGEFGDYKMFELVKKQEDTKDDIIEYLLDMLEEEHMGMRAFAIKEIADKFNIEL